MRATIPHFGKLFVFALLSFADLFLTWHLLEQGTGQVYESNPIARWWLEQHGWLGLVLFKLGVVVVVAGLALLISRYRPRAGGCVLTFACSAVALVVLYSSSLAGYIGKQPDAFGMAELERDLAKDRQLEQRLRAVRDYHALLNRFSGDWLAQRCTLTEAIDQLAGSPNAHNANWLRVIYQRYPGYTKEQCLAANLLEHVLSMVGSDSSLDRLRIQELVAEYQDTYGVVVPGRVTQ